MTRRKPSWLRLPSSYDTTTKRQIDRLIGELKSPGIWGKLDWYGNAFWALNEHDALLNWVNPAQTLTKVGGATWILGQGLKGVDPMADSGRYKSAWNVGDGPHSTATSFAMFCKITSVDVPQDGMQPMGLFEYNTPGPRPRSFSSCRSHRTQVRAAETFFPLTVTPASRSAMAWAYGEHLDRAPTTSPSRTA